MPCFFCSRDKVGSSDERVAVPSQGFLCDTCGKYHISNKLLESQQISWLRDRTTAAREIIKKDKNEAVFLLPDEVHGNLPGLLNEHFRPVQVAFSGIMDLTR